MPPFVTVLKEVTDDTVYASRTMAKQDYKMPFEDKRQIKQSLAKANPGTPITKKEAVM